MSSLAGKIALVTGASRGIGRAIAIRLAREGAALVLVARSVGELEQLQLRLQSDGGEASICVADLRLVSVANDLHALVLAKYQRIDILVNCAGATRIGDFLTLTEEDWAEGFALKFHAARRLCAIFWNDLAATQGSILNVVGTAGRMPGMDYGIGGSVNAALLALTKSLAERGIRDGVQVNAVNPGPVRTDRQAANIARVAKDLGISGEAAVSELARQFGMTRIGEPEDIAALVGLIVSPAGRFFHGSLIDMDGGQMKSI